MKVLVASAALAGAIVIFLAGRGVAGPNCTCRYAGQNHEIGTIMCIMGKLSRCDYVLNNTAWKKLADTCPQVRRQTPVTPATRTAAAPVLAPQ